MLQLVHNVEPSATTDQKYYMEASEFAGINNTFDKFNKAIESEHLAAREAPGLKPLDKEITGLVSPRQLVKWAYSADEHDVSNVMKFGNKYVVAAVEDVKKKGYADLDDVKTAIQLELTKRKKADKLSEEIADKSGGTKSMDQLAATLGTTVMDAASINFQTRTLGSIGIEPDIPAAAFALKDEVISQPVTGNSGVFVIEVTSEDQPQDIELLTQREKMIYERSYTSQTNYVVFDALKKRADVIDNRAKFF